MDQTNYNINLTQLLSNYSTGNNMLIKQTDKTIAEEFHNNYDVIIVALANIVNDENTNSSLRRLAALILKNNLSQINKNNVKVNKWISLNTELRNQVRNLILSTLGTFDFEIVKIVSLCVSQIAKTEFASNQGKEIVEILLNALGHDSINYKYAALLTLQYIFQDIEIDSMNNVEVEYIFGKLFENMKLANDENLYLYYCKVIKEMIPFSKQIFIESEKQNTLIDYIYLLFDCKSFEIKKTTINCITECYKYYYDIINTSHFPKLLKLTNFVFENTAYFNDDSCKYKIIKSNNNAEAILYSEKLTQAILECWEAISEREIKLTTISNSVSMLQNRKNKGYCSDNFKTITNYIFSKMVNTGPINRDEYWNFIKTGCLVLMNFSNCCSSKYIDLVIEFVINHYKCEDIVLKERAILAFSSILETGYRNKIKDYVSRCLEEFLLLVSYEQLRETIGFTVERIFKYFAELFIQNKLNLKRYVDFFLFQIFEYFHKDRIFTIHICNAIGYYCKKFPKEYSKYNSIIN
jgi:hypothetical protein